MSKRIKGKYIRVSGTTNSCLVGEVRYLDKKGRLSGVEDGSGCQHAGPFRQQGDVYICGSAPNEWVFKPDAVTPKKPREYMLLVRFHDGNIKLYGSTNRPNTWPTKKAAEKQGAKCIAKWRTYHHGLSYTVVRKGKVYE